MWKEREQFLYHKGKKKDEGFLRANEGQVDRSIKYNSKSIIRPNHIWKFSIR